MAIVPTGAIYKSLVFDGESSRGYGIYITGQAVYNAPDRDVEMISIPGRNGSFALDKGRFQNIEVTYPAGIFADNEADFAQGISDFRNFLCSRNGYVRLTDDYNPDEYRMAVYKSGLDVSPAQLKAGEFQLVFDCKPQRFLTSGEEPITIGEWHETETASGEIASFEAVDGDAIKSLVAEFEPIQSFNGYDKPWSGGAGKNKLSIDATSATRGGITFTVNSDGSIKAVGTNTSGAEILWRVHDTTAIPSDFSGAKFNGAVSNSLGLAIAYTDDNGAWKGAQILTTTADTTIAIPSGATKYFVAIRIPDGSTVNGTVYPMIRLATETDATYAPYENICPISGYDSVVVSRCGRNLLNVDDAEIGTAWNGSSNSARARIVIPCEPNTAYTLSMNGTMSVDAVYYVSSKAIPPTAIAGPVTFPVRFTTSASHKYITLGFNKTAITKADIEALKLQLEFGSTATAYEPYQGNAYTIDLNGTRYGGTLDVVSGVLTVDRAIVTLNGTESNTWYLSNPSASQIVYTTPNVLPGVKTTGGFQQKASCNLFRIIQSISQRTVGTAYVDIGYFNMVFAPSTFSTSADVKTWLTSNNLQIVYELATPTTVQLTAQEVELLVGLNQIWANSGDVSVEYGTAPNVVYNPTLFESSPMLEVEGYGSIGFNGYEIDIENGTLGEVTLWDRYANAVQNSSINKTVSIPSGLLNNGDTFYVNGYTINGYNGVNAHVAGDAASITSYTHSGVSDVAISCRAELGTQTSPFGNYYAHFWINVRFPSLQFEVGTPLSYVDQEHVYYTYMFYGSTASGEIYIETSVEYDGDSTITFSERGLASSKALQYIEYAIPQGVGISSNPIMGHPTYIDCDLGEAYKIEDGAIVSLNQYIDLGSDLPKFASGANEIIYDDTITDLKVAPRWWKI